MKRSRSINLAAMRKQAVLNLPAKPLALAIAVSSFTGCSSNEPARVFQTVEECVQAQVGNTQECQLAYDQALAEAQKSGPKYGSLSDCQAEFGAGQCTQYGGGGGQNWFVPLMAGYMIGEVIDEIGDSFERKRYRSAPLYTSYNHRSPFFGQWSSVDGHSYGSVRDRRIKVSKKSFDSKPAVKKTIKRGGFGSKVAAKSSWGGGSRGSRGWGG